VQPHAADIHLVFFGDADSYTLHPGLEDCLAERKQVWYAVYVLDLLQLIGSLQPFKGQRIGLETQHIEQFSGDFSPIHVNPLQFINNGLPACDVILTQSPFSMLTGVFNLDGVVYY
jgi:hypothetical protein